LYIFIRLNHNLLVIQIEEDARLAIDQDRIQLHFRDIVKQRPYHVHIAVSYTLKVVKQK
jgi:galactose mutarotase-like enzyme